MSAEDVKSFYDYEGADLSFHLPDGIYHLKVAGYTVDFWDEEEVRPRLGLETTIVDGEFEGFYGPRVQWDFGGTGTTKDGRAFTVKLEDAMKRLAVQSTAIMGGRVPVSRPNEPNAQMLEEVGAALKNKEFFARVTTGKNGYLQIDGRGKAAGPARGVFPLSSPPDSAAPTKDVQV